ncbi:hypothetical protein [Streptomyces sp. NRRL F-5126]|uniref:SCO2583 family membrane protein n=1 Tax=Streptomyces sp. NRRL F-5126 TaxID=1463857 RepID=UPI000690B775|nr:hypothetical protein [Streptomyces sp. NRRL F-5126]
MAGHGDPPEGTPDGPPGGDDEYRSVVFDESFVRAARIQELSARERMAGSEHAVRTRGSRAGAATRGPRRGPHPLLTLFVLLALAFGAAVYLGFRQPSRPPGTPRSAAQLRMTVVPLAPTADVPGGTPAELLANSPAKSFHVGGEGIPTPVPKSTAHFSASQVGTALGIAKSYLVASALNPDVLAGRDRDAVRDLLDPAQTGQFDRSFAAPDADGLHEPAGWLVSFDPAKVRQADGAVRVHGSMAYRESADRALEVSTHHTFVYLLRPAGSTAKDAASLFTVRRELRFRFDMSDLETKRARLVQSDVDAGPEACSAAARKAFAPLLAGASAPSGDPVEVDPFAPGRLTGDLCGALGAPGRSAPAHAASTHAAPTHSPTAH